MPPIYADTGWLDIGSALPWILRARDINRLLDEGDVPWSPRETYILRVLATTASAFSVTSAVVAFYWFVKMRRSFRHHLIMLLIQSDMFKALWYMIHPVVLLSQGEITTDSKFCQASGWFISVSIEASDFAILMIAIHTALYIWKPASSMGEGGLYPYRHIAYILWIIFPALMASLAFVNPDKAYTAQATYCYLPIRPNWYRLALAWIPRYIIFGTITTIYISIYVYVHYKFKNVDSDVGGSYNQHKTPQSDETAVGSNMSPTSPKDLGPRSSWPPTPTLFRHGLIPSVPPSAPASAVDPSSRKASLASSNNGRPVSRVPELENFTFAGLDSTMTSETHEHVEQTNPDSSRGTPETGESTLAPESCSPSGPFSAFRGFKFDDAASTPIEEQPQPDLRISLVDSNGHSETSDALRRKRIVISRQLRFLFIYPLVYMFMWIVPFISQVMQYTEYSIEHPSFVLTCFVTVIVPFQCAVDCWLFSSREKPWRYIPGSKGTFFDSFLFWTHDKAGEASGKSSVPSSRARQGKSRMEMAAEAKAAYRRRAAEMAQSAETSRDRAYERKMSLVRRGGREKSWWDEEGKRRRDSVFMDSFAGGSIAGIVEEGAEPKPDLHASGPAQRVLPASPPPVIRQPILRAPSPALEEKHLTE